MINPGTITVLRGFTEGIPMAKAVLGGTVYSIVLGYTILKVLRHFYSGSFDKIKSYMYALLFILNGIFIAIIFYIGIAEALHAVRQMQVDNSANSHLYGINYLFAGLNYLASYLPYALNILIVFSAMSLITNFRQDRYSEEALASARRLTGLCGKALSIIILANIAYNILQLIFSTMLFNVNSTIPIPVFSVIFILACLLFVKLLQENKALKDDIESII
jgi:hypothetical protein